MNRFEVEVGGVMIQVPSGTAESWWCLILYPVMIGEDGVKQCITIFEECKYAENINDTDMEGASSLNFIGAIKYGNTLGEHSCKHKKEEISNCQARKGNQDTCKLFSMWVWQVGVQVLTWN